MPPLKRNAHPPPAAVVLQPAVQHYDWGDHRFIPRALGLRHPADAPHAEAWYGAHPRAPSTCPAYNTTFDEFLSTHPALAPKTAGKVTPWPYLLKLLSAKHPLSIQVHPNATQAREGFERQNTQKIPLDAPHRTFKDPNHKPELVVAQTPFWALCGFRPFPEMASALEHLNTLQRWRPAPSNPSELRDFLEAWFHLSPQTRAQLMQDAITRAGERAPPFKAHEPEYWLLRLTRDSPDMAEDPGLLFLFLLNLVTLQPDDALYLEAQVPHAYLRGAGIEIMANSDNVLRAGLTRKHVDPSALQRVMTHSPHTPHRITPRTQARPDATAALLYSPPVTEFRLSQIRVRETHAPISRNAGRAELVVTLPEDPTHTTDVMVGGGRLALNSGQACAVAEGTHYTVVTQGPTTLFWAQQP